jgi:hypothetical protein
MPRYQIVQFAFPDGGKSGANPLPGRVGQLYAKLGWSGMYGEGVGAGFRVN